jgi:hypothetical protein
VLDLGNLDGSGNSFENEHLERAWREEGLNVVVERLA